VRILFAFVCSLVLAMPAARALEDPTRPPAGKEPAADRQPARQFTLSSVMIGEQRRMAVIDGQPRKVGEVFDGVRVRSISAAGVELVVDGDVRVLQLQALPGIRSVQ
jgi:MSHA biogenesis protein MshK